MRTVAQRLSSIPVVCALIACSPLAAQEIEFHFAPETGKTFRVETNREQTTDFRGTPATDKYEFHTRERYERGEDGYVLHQKILTNRMTRNGSEIQSPMNMLLSEIDIRFRIDDSGKVTSVEGFDSIPELFKEKFPAPVFSAFAPMINLKSLENQQVDRWDQRHEAFLGKKAKIGGRLLTADLLTLPRGGSLLVYNVYRFPERIEHEGHSVLRVELDFDSDAAALAKRAEVTAEELAEAAGELSGGGQGHIFGGGEILVDDHTLSVYSIETTKTMETEVPLPGKDEAEPYRSVEKYRLERVPGAEPAPSPEPK